MSEIVPCHPACPHCGNPSPVRNPFPTVDVVVYRPHEGILLIARKNPPLGWALPGGFIDYGESAEQAALREAREETGLVVRIRALLGVYSRPDRDPRFHTMSVVFWVDADEGVVPCAGDDAAKARFFPLASLPEIMAFDHREIVGDFVKRVRGDV